MFTRIGWYFKQKSPFLPITIVHHFLCALNCKIRKRIGGLRQFRKSLLSGQIITGLGRARKDLSVAKSFLKNSIRILPWHLCCWYEKCGQWKIREGASFPFCVLPRSDFKLLMSNDFILKSKASAIINKRDFLYFQKASSVSLSQI